jgi:hypothetical protein
MSRKKKPSEGIAFIVRMNTGTEYRLLIDTFTLRSGDHVARVIAKEHQRLGQIPKGEITEVRRVPLSAK